MKASVAKRVEAAEMAAAASARKREEAERKAKAQRRFETAGGASMSRDELGRYLDSLLTPEHREKQAQHDRYVASLPPEERCAYLTQRLQALMEGGPVAW